MLKSRRLKISLVSIFAFVFTVQSHATKIVIMRHGEKPPAGLGQLDCQGLNRSLALIKVLDNKFGKPNHIFAPNPAEKVLDFGLGYNYIRPLATIEPTAIYYGMPVNTQFGFTQVSDLAEELLKIRYKFDLIFVAWEHLNAVDLMKKIVSLAGSDIEVPEWHGSDFDSLYIIEVDPLKLSSMTLIHDQQNLNGLPTSCPQAP